MTPRMKGILVWGLVMLPVLGIGYMGFVAPKVIVGVRGNTLTIREPMTLANESYIVDEQTRIVRDGRPVGLQNLKIGDHVTVDAANDDHDHPVAVRVVATSVGKGPAHALEQLKLQTDKNLMPDAIEVESADRSVGSHDR